MGNPLCSGFSVVIAPMGVRNSPQSDVLYSAIALIWPIYWPGPIDSRLNWKTTMNTRIVITGMGCLSPLGNDVQSTWQSAIAGKSGVGAITLFDATDHETRIAAEVKGFDPVAQFGRKEARRMDRYTQFAVAATDAALKDSRLEINEANRHRVGVFMGTGIGGGGTVPGGGGGGKTRGPRPASPLLGAVRRPGGARGAGGRNFFMCGAGLWALFSL